MPGYKKPMAHGKKPMSFKQISALLDIPVAELQFLNPSYKREVVPFITGAQKKDKNIPKGNDFFMDNKYSDAEADYRISESLNPKNSIASYNLGNSIYKQNQVAESKYHYLKAIKNAKTKAEKHKARAAELYKKNLNQNTNVPQANTHG